MALITTSVMPTQNCRVSQTRFFFPQSQIVKAHFYVSCLSCASTVCYLAHFNGENARDFLVAI